VLGQLRAAGALGALERAQLVAAAAALAEALQQARALEAGRLEVHLADAALLVVRAQARQLAPAALDLHGGWLSFPRTLLVAVLSEHVPRMCVCGGKRGMCACVP